FGRLAGYEDVNDAERLCRDPAMRWVVGDRAPMGRAASASQMGRFETGWLPGRRTSPLLPTAWPMDRHCAQAAPAEDHCARYGIEREPDLWQAGGERLHSFTGPDFCPIFAPSMATMGQKSSLPQPAPSVSLR